MLVFPLVAHVKLAVVNARYFCLTEPLVELSPLQLWQKMADLHFYEQTDSLLHLFQLEFR